MDKTFTFSSNLTGVLIQKAIELAFKAGSARQVKDSWWDYDDDRHPPTQSDLEGIDLSDELYGDERKEIVDEIMSALHDYLPEAEKIAKEEAG